MSAHPLKFLVELSPLLRFGVSLVVGIATGIPLWSTDAVGALLLGWALTAGVFVLWTWAILWPMDSADTSAHAGREEPTQAGTFAIILFAPFMSLAGVIIALSRQSDGAVATAIALAAVVTSWLAIHTMYAMHYARMYYGGEPNGGIDFHQDDDPRYSDFAYISGTIGMSFAMSDTDLTDSRFRRVVVGQSLLSYLFGTVIVALLVTLIAGVAA